MTVSRELLAILGKVLELFQNWLRRREREQAEKERERVVRDGADALIGLFGKPAGTGEPTAPAHPALDGADEPGRPAGRVDEQ